MNRHRLDPLLDLARSREEAAARELAEKSKALSHQEQRLAELSRYVGEYAAPATGVIHPAALLNRLAFRERIDDAVARQASAVEVIRANCDLERTRLMLAGRDTKVLEKLAAGYEKLVRRKEERHEQGQLDELAARGFLQQRREGETS